MNGGMRFDNDDIRALPLHMQEQVGVALVAQIAQANPVAVREETKEEQNMLKCDPRAYARCPYKGSCVDLENAQFPEGGDCHLFNQKVLSSQMTEADYIRTMSDPQLYLFLYTLTRSCAEKNCQACPIGAENCANLRQWLKSIKTEGY